MKRYEISWLKEFECLADSCPQSCCKGWVIPLEDEDIERFRQEKGRLAMAFMIATGAWTRQSFNADSGSCPFLRKDGLCRLQKEKGHEFIPWTCQSFPRFYRNFGPFEEVCLDLSCIGAAGIFIRHRGDLTTNESEGEAVTAPCTSNDDMEYLNLLLRLRRELTGSAAGGITGELADRMFSFAMALQDDFATKKDISYEDISFEGFEYHNDKNESYSFPLPAKVICELLDSSLFHPRLAWGNPVLYRLLGKAKKMMNRLVKKDLWYETVRRTLSEDPMLSEVLTSYLSYHLYQYFMRTFETYSFRRQTALMLIHTNMILLLAVAGKDGRPVSEEDLASFIAAYNRRAYFSESIQDEMYRIFEDNSPFIRYPS
ncbi:MAG: flagellin lysine-N-methylase [Lachnospiraceae bacterium]|nr:flagellin lysine-N-methylase [Lachnospiraceae bacterium]